MDEGIANISANSRVHGAAPAAADLIMHKSANATEKANLSLVMYAQDALRLARVLLSKNSISLGPSAKDRDTSLNI